MCTQMRARVETCMSWAGTSHLPTGLYWKPIGLSENWCDQAWSDIILGCTEYVWCFIIVVTHKTYHSKASRGIIYSLKYLYQGNISVHYLKLQQIWEITIRATSPNTTGMKILKHNPLRSKPNKSVNKPYTRTWSTQSLDWDEWLKLQVRATIIRTYRETMYVMNYKTMKIMSLWSYNHCTPLFKLLQPQIIYLARIFQLNQITSLENCLLIT